MTELTPDARDLIEAARAGEGRAPSDARARVRARVLTRVGAAAAVGSATMLGSTTTAAKTGLGAVGATTGLLFKVAAGVGVASMIAVVTVKTGVLSSSDRGAAKPVAAMPASSAGATVVAKAEPPPAPPVLATALASASPAPASPASAEAGKPLTLAPSAARPRAVAPPSASSLEAETAVLEKAQAELREGHPDRALAALDEQDAELKHGVLGEERRAARILALCAAGRTAEAKTEAQRFLAEWPRSPMAARVRSSCGGDGAP